MSDRLQISIQVCQWSVDTDTMKLRYQHSSRYLSTSTPARGYSRVVLPLLAALMIFFLLPGLLAAQEAGEVIAPDAGAEPDVAGLPASGPPESAPALNDQATAAAVAAAQPGSTAETPTMRPLSRELRQDRLWLLPRHAEFTDLLQRAARQALQHADCNEVLYGNLNEFQTERVGTSFTILCMKDARTTFNQVFFADDLMSDEELTAAEETPDGSEELERLRQMMGPSDQPGAIVQPSQIPTDIVPDDLPAPTVF